jgi:hypothetical protein
MLNEDRNLTDLVNKLFDVKPNPEIVKALKGELKISSENIPNFIKNMELLINSYKDKDKD